MIAGASRRVRLEPIFGGMRNTILALAATAVLALPAVASDRVTVAAPLLNVVTNMQRLRSVCSSDADFDACTRFVAFRLSASCQPTGDRWSMDATATFRPWIFLQNLG